MRCPTCGTENVPDSRFCGACGAKLTPAENRVAPTAKISDDAPFPAHYGSQSPQSYAPASIAPHNNGPASIPPNTFQAANYQSGPASIPPNTYQAPNYQSGPASIPPNTYQAPASIPPTNLGFGGKPASIPPQNQMYGRAQSVATHEPSMSMPVVARPRWGLIILVLLLDVGLAAAGAVMLQKGLAKPEPVEAPPAHAGSATPIAPKAEVAPATPSTASPTVAASIAAVASGSGSAAASDATPAKADPKKPAASKPKPGPSPQDPYEAGNNLRAEIELSVARSKEDINNCRDAAGPDLHGRIDIGFRVQLDGRVDTLKILANTTHIAPLATCLETVISHWTFASHPAQPSDFVRPFIY